MNGPGPPPWALGRPRASRRPYSASGGLPALDVLGRPWAELPCWAVCLWALRRLGHPVEPEDLARPWRWRELAAGVPLRLGDVACGEGGVGLHTAVLYDEGAALWLTSSKQRGVHGMSTRVLHRTLHSVAVYRWKGDA